VTALWEGFQGGLLWLLDFFHGYAGDYGVAIVMLTVMLRVIMIPLTMKQTKSMHEMQRIQPKIKQLQAKYKDNKEKQQEELMKFYKDNKVNPLGGCLPLILQMPIFLALFRVLQDYEKLENARFWIILPDLSLSPSTVFSGDGLVAAIPYLVFVVLFGLSAWLPQKMMTKDPQQSKMGSYMALFMLYIGWISPAGVLVYWVTSSAWQVGQQYLMLRMMSQEEGA